MTNSSQILQVSADLPSELTTFFTSTLAPQIVVDANNSLSNALQWHNALPPLPTLLAANYFAPEFNFFANTAPTSDAAWSAALATNFTSSNDYLWVRFRHQRLSSRIQLFEVPMAPQLNDVMLASELNEV